VNDLKVIFAEDKPQTWAVVDADQFDRLMGSTPARIKKAGYVKGYVEVPRGQKNHWQGTRSGHLYTIRRKAPDGTPEYTWLHRLAVRARNYQFVAFKNGDERDCTRRNLKLCRTKEEVKKIQRKALERIIHGKQSNDRPGNGHVRRAAGGPGPEGTGEAGGNGESNSHDPAELGAG
jgi:hypothetical protein